MRIKDFRPGGKHATIGKGILDYKTVLSIEPVTDSSRDLAIYASHIESKDEPVLLGRYNLYTDAIQAIQHLVNELNG